MRSIILFTLCMSLVSCKWEVSTDTQGETVAVSQENNDCRPDGWDTFCTSVKIQIYFSQDEILQAPIIRGDLATRYQLSEFHAFLIGGTHAYASQADDTGQFRFNETEPGAYTLLIRLIPARGNGIYFDCDLERFDANGNPLATPICVKIPNAEPYYIGGRQDNIVIRESQRVEVGLLHPQKLFINGGWQDSVQAVTKDNSAHIERVTPIYVGGI